MGFFNKKRKEEKVLRQDLNQKEENNSVFIMHLFMKEHCEMPDKNFMTSIMEKHLGNVECFCHDEKTAGFAANKYQIEFKDATASPMLMVMGCHETKDYQIDELTRSQMWDCPNSQVILDDCKYQIVAVDMMANGMEYRQRADMLMDYMEALVEMYPTAEAIQFQTSGKMFTREQILNKQIPKEDRFIYFAVNVRFFNIQNSSDKIVDTLGMNILGLPDLQYHFHDLDPNAVVNHAYNIASYIFENENPIKQGDLIDGVEDGKISMNVQWKCHYEQSLIQPVREVVDIYMNEYAAGKRN